jgi:hypothetical protein
MKINKLEEIENFYMWSDPKAEIFNAISNHDYFKAFSLSSTVYEFLTKKILVNHFKDIDLIINEKKIRGLGLETAITMLYTQKLIDQPIYSALIDVNRMRSNFIQHKLFQTIGKEDFKKILQTLPKLERTIDKLEKLYEWSEKQKPKFE